MRVPRVLVAALTAVLSSHSMQLMAQAAVVPASDDTARVIVQFKAGAALLREKSLSVPATSAARAKALGTRLGMALRAGAPVSEQAQVVFASGVTSQALAQRLAQEADVEYAVPDQRNHIVTAPNDPLYAAGIPGNGPAVGQWYLRAPSDVVLSSMNVEAAWALTTGSPGIVVAVLDTGVRFDHPDLLAVAAGGNLLPGYDMISDTAAANDGNGRDGDAADPGDWVSQAEIAQRGGQFYQCQPSATNSSWHGTQVSGLIAALTDNGIGLASVARNVRVLPVRALGKCGGFLSDIIVGMRWAAGLSVPGVPANLNRAQVINLSLGSVGPCSAAYQQAVNDVTAAGSVIVVAAGNTTGHAAGAPANCIGVIAVAGLRHAGTKVGFSDLGPDITISAPAGNCVNITAGSPCLYPILTTSNSGTTGPVAPIYTDSLNRSLGTSFSAPLVSGTVALMLSVQPGLTPQQVAQMLQTTARPFPPGGGLNSDGTPVPACTAPQFYATGTPVDQLECQCTTSTCGAGMVDAGAAVLAAFAGTSGSVATVVEYYHAALYHYFITWKPDEIVVLDAGIQIKGWKRTGYSFRTYPSPHPGTSPVCRFYIPPAIGDSHFFGRGTVECNATSQHFPSFTLEDPNFMQMFLPAAGTCPADTTPVYRVFDNRADANHRYTTSRDVRSMMVAKGWIAEGDGPDLVVMCAPP